MKLKKYFLLLPICFSIISYVYSYSVITLDNFRKTETYTTNTFTDIKASDWYAENVKSVYEYGLMNGKGNSLFDPKGNITIAEAITMTVRINNVYNLGFISEFDSATPWYAPYTDYAKQHNLVKKDYPNYNKAATRAEFAEILAKSIDPVDLEEICIIADGAIPDVDVNSDYADAVYLLYRAGVLTGSDEAGTFNPSSTITRAEAATIITRTVDPALRKTIELASN